MSAHPMSVVVKWILIHSHGKENEFALRFSETVW